MARRNGCCPCPFLAAMPVGVLPIFQRDTERCPPSYFARAAAPIGAPQLILCDTDRCPQCFLRGADRRPTHFSFMQPVYFVRGILLLQLFQFATLLLQFSNLFRMGYVWNGLVASAADLAVGIRSPDPT